ADCCSSASTKRLNARDFSRFLPKSTINTTASTIAPVTIKNEFINNPGLVNLKSKKSFSTIENANPQSTHMIPNMPATPNPGITNTSSTSKTTPTKKTAISQWSATP